MFPNQYILLHFRFTLLVGKPPFETSSLKDTYTKIKKNEYHVPSRVSPAAKNLIIKLLKADPSERPGMGGLLEDEFFTTGLLYAHFCLEKSLYEL